MSRYIARRLVLLIPVLFGVVTLVFAVIHLIPGDPAMVVAGPHATDEDVEAIRKSLDLDKPLHVQYVLFLNRLIHGDLGRSNITGLPVITEVAARIPTTVKLTIGGMLFAIALGPLLGLVAAIRQNSALDYISSAAAVLGLSLPAFWSGLMLILVFSERLGWLPSMGSGSGGIRYWILPSITLGAASVGMLARMMRATTLETLNEPYIWTARAKGVPEFFVITRHLLKNALIPMITIIGLRVGYMLGGAMVIETVFSLPGLGRQMVSAVINHDYPVVQGAVLVVALSFILVNLIVDILYSLLDPRIRTQG